MAVDTSAPRSRRALLAAMLGGVGALAAQAVARPLPVSAADPNDVVKDVDNPTTAVTSITQATADTAALTATGAGTGHGVKGVSTTGTGLHGESQDNTASTFLETSHRTGVIGTAGDPADMAVNTDEVGVYGYSDVSLGAVGLFGHSWQGTGLLAVGDVGTYSTGGIGVLGDVGPSGTGLYGFAGAAAAGAPPAGVGVYAAAESNLTALQVNGRARFSRSGRIAVASGRTSVVKTIAGVTTTSMVFAVLQTAETGTWVRAAVPTAGRITIYFNRSLPSSAVVAYFVLN